jgi:SAM-dependent methyltransferase
MGVVSDEDPLSIGTAALGSGHWARRARRLRPLVLGAGADAHFGLATARWWTGESRAQAVLDVACGTGVVARHGAGLVEPGGRVVGLDLNEAMLTVARRVRPDIEWRHGHVSALPFDDGGFDAVVSQMALMFLPDRARALAEMAQVVRADATVAVLVPGSLAGQAVFAPFVEMAGRHVGPEARSRLATYFACGDLDAPFVSNVVGGPPDRACVRLNRRHRPVRRVQRANA